MSVYGFDGKNLTPEFPSQVIVDVTEVCNLACVHCPHPAFKQSEHYAARYLDPALNSKIVGEVSQHGAQYIRYTSEGEPLIHPGIYDMLEEAVMYSGTFVTLTTNGTILNEKRIAKLLQAGLHMVDVSIDAFMEATYAKIRVGGDLQVTRENTLRLIELARGTATKIVVSYIEQPENSHETKDFEYFWKGAGASAVVVRRLHSAAGAIKPVAIRMHSDHVRLPRRPCVYPWERISLTPRGWLAFCPADWTHGSSMVDYRTTTVKEWWDSPAYRRLRMAHISNDFSAPAHQFCGQCPDWAATRWPHEGKRYADLIENIKHDAD